MLKPYSRNIRKIDDMLRNTYLQNIQTHVLDTLLKKCLFSIHEYQVDDRHYLSTFTFDTSKYCFVLCTYPPMLARDFTSTEIEIYSPRNTRRMYRIEYDSEITLYDSINPMTDYVVPKDNTLYVIETSYNSMRTIKKVIHDSVEELERELSHA